jgi:hypothetical protein
MQDYPGVYICKCFGNGKVYVGSSLHVLQRIKEHKAALAKGKHRNKHLQFAYKKFKRRWFRWRVVEKNPENRFEREQAWVEKLQAADRRFGFNRAYPVRVSEPNPTASRIMKNYWKNPKYRAMWEASLVKGSNKVSKLLKEDPLFAAKISNIRKNMWKPETRQRLSKQAKERLKDKKYEAEHAVYLAVGRQKLKELRKDPKFVANQVKGMVARWKDPEARKKQAARMAALWKNPEFRAKQLEKSVRQIVAYNKSRRAAKPTQEIVRSTVNK